MISLILPYWDRQEAADKALALLAEQYVGLDIEVVIVDDGNRVPFLVPALPLEITVVRLPAKSEPKSPCTPWNAGVKAARGDIIILSCIEVLHTTPVIQAMVEQLRAAGQMGYVLAAAWCPDDGIWHCHSSVKVPTCPDGSGIGFCSALHKDLYQAVGGFDEKYRDGAGYEDRDFIWRLHKAGAKFITRDDLVVVHPKAGATIRWKPEGFKRNEELYYSKWSEAMAERGKEVTFLCLKVGDAYGPEYVNILRDMIMRNLPDGFLGRFVCMTDDIQGLDDGIGVISLPDDLETWWGKLYMFKRGLFREGERIVFMDLDTIIVGALDEIVQYEGEFATLRDFYYPERVGPAIISWRAGDLSASIWDEWVAQGKPRNPMGDLWWINNLDQGRFARRIDKLQDLYPHQFASFKADCDPYPPKGTRVVCFHGQPKPSNCAVDWIANVWRVGGGTAAELEAVANMADEAVRRNILSACERTLTWLEYAPEQQRHAVIVGGGPSLAKTIGEVRWRKERGDYVFALNGAARYLNEEGIVPDAQVIMDARPGNDRFVSSALAAEYFIASQCDKAVFDASGPSTTVFHMNTSGIEEILPKDREAHLVSSGTTVGLAAMVVAYMLGYRTLHLHGYDSSYDDSHHAYEQPENDHETVVDVIAGGRAFRSATWMVKQAQQFQELAIHLADEGVTITVAGDGLLPHIARCMTQQPMGEQKHVSR